MANNLIVSTSPHLHSGASARKIMLDVLIALSPAAIASVVLFGLKALLIIAVSVGAAVLSEFLFNLIVKKEQTIGDLSAVVTGLLLALTLPATTKWWQVMVGAVFAIVVVKCLFGGLGCNFANPAITARIMMLISFGQNVGGGTATNFGSLELTAGATPLAAMKAGVETTALPSLFNMLIGNRGGAIGEGCAIALLLGLVYLLVRKVITWHTPAVFVGATFLLALACTGFNFTESLYHVLGGGLLIGAIFMATDYVTSPINKWGKVVFAVGCAVFTIIIRFLANLPEGVSYAILLMNILSPYIEKLCAPKPLGAAAKKGGKA